VLAVLRRTHNLEQQRICGCTCVGCSSGSNTVFRTDYGDVNVSIVGLTQRLLLPGNMLIYLVGRTPGQGEEEGKLDQGDNVTPDNGDTETPGHGDTVTETPDRQLRLRDQTPDWKDREISHQGEIEAISTRRGKNTSTCSILCDTDYPRDYQGLTNLDTDYSSVCYGSTRSDKDYSNVCHGTTTNLDKDYCSHTTINR
jgi:hypothetical protein